MAVDYGERWQQSKRERQQKKEGGGESGAKKKRLLGDVTFSRLKADESIKEECRVLGSRLKKAKQKFDDAEAAFLADGGAPPELRTKVHAEGSDDQEVRDALKDSDVGTATALVAAGDALRKTKEQTKKGGCCELLVTQWKSAREALEKSEADVRDAVQRLAANGAKVDDAKNPLEDENVGFEARAELRPLVKKRDDHAKAAERAEMTARLVGCEGMEEKQETDTQQEPPPSPPRREKDDTPPGPTSCIVPPPEATKKKEFGFTEDRAIPQQRPAAGSCGLGGGGPEQKDAAAEVCGDTETTNRAVREAGGASSRDVKPSTDTLFPIAVLGHAAGSRYVEEDPAVVAARALREKRDRIRRDRRNAGVGFGWMMHPRLAGIRRWFSYGNKPRGWILAVVAVVLIVAITFAIEKLPLSWLSFLKTRFVVTGCARMMDRFGGFRRFVAQLDKLHLTLTKLNLTEFMLTNPVFVMAVQPLWYPKYVLGLLVAGIVPLTSSGNVLLLAKEFGLQWRIRAGLVRLRRWMLRREFTRSLRFVVPPPDVAALYMPRLMMILSAAAPLPLYRLLLGKLGPAWDEWLFDAVPPLLSSFLGLCAGLAALVCFGMEDVLSSTAPDPRDSRENLVEEEEEADEEKEVANRRRGGSGGLENASLYVACCLAFFLALFVITRHLYPEVRRYNHLRRLEGIAKFVDV